MHRPPVSPWRASLAAPAIVALAASLVGCGSAQPTAVTQSPTPDGQAKRFQASGFSTLVPHGWTDRTNDQQAVAAVSASGTMQMLLIAPSATGAVSNEHIDVTTVAQPVPDDQLAPYLESVGQNGATSVSGPQPFNLDGAAGLFVTYNLTAAASPPAQPATLKVQDMLINHAGVTYEIVLNTSQSDFAPHLQALQEVLSTWHWSS